MVPGLSNQIQNQSTTRIPTQYSRKMLSAYYTSTEKLSNSTNGLYKTEKAALRNNIIAKTQLYEKAGEMHMMHMQQ